MSFGTKHATFRGVNQGMKPVFQKHFPLVQESVLDRMLEIATNKIVVETLLFVALLSMISRKIEGEHEDEPNCGHFGTGVKLSAVSKDGTCKMQSKEMELLHDVIVELWMSQRFVAQMQQLLKSQGWQLSALHSCYLFLVDDGEVDEFLQAAADDEFRRTQLDESGMLLKGVDPKALHEKTEYTTREHEIVEEIFACACEAVGAQHLSLT